MFSSTLNTGLQLKPKIMVNTAELVNAQYSSRLTTNRQRQEHERHV